jgi:hypothetical protein
VVKRSEGTLPFKVLKLSSYAKIDKPTNTLCTNVLFLKNLPFRIIVSFKPSEENNDIDVGIYLNLALTKEMRKAT